MPTLTEIQQKLKNYCIYQERSHYEVIQKLYSLGIRKTDVELVTAWLIENNHLNEERFAISFARGKFKLKKWGRIKIKHELLLKKVSIRNISTALGGIDEAVYQHTMETLANKKWNSLKADKIAIKKMKTLRYMMQKGYESNLVRSVINKLFTEYKA